MLSGGGGAPNADCAIAPTVACAMTNAVRARLRNGGIVTPTDISFPAELRL